VCDSTVMKFHCVCFSG